MPLHIHVGAPRGRRSVCTGDGKNNGNKQADMVSAFKYLTACKETKVQQDQRPGQARVQGLA